MATAGSSLSFCAAVIVTPITSLEHGPGLDTANVPAMFNLQVWFLEFVISESF